MCQLHGGDIGVSSKSGEGSTFGFYFKVRRQSGTPGEGRPPFSTRSSDSSSTGQQLQASRPSYSRANSNLRRIKELEDEQGTTNKHNKDDGNEVEENQKEQRPNDERPSMKGLTSNAGIDPEEQGMNESLKNPPTEYRPEAHPESSRDVRYEETKEIVDRMEDHPPPPEKPLPDLHRGETERQESRSLEQSKSMSQKPSNTHNTLLLVEDNVINQKVLRRQLQSKGFEVSLRNYHLCQFCLGRIVEND